jgi:hypothetical protein
VLDSMSIYFCSWCKIGLDKVKDRTLDSVVVREPSATTESNSLVFACHECTDRHYLVPYNEGASLDAIIRQQKAQGKKVPWCEGCGLPSGFRSRLAPSLVAKLDAMRCWHCAEPQLRRAEYDRCMRASFTGDSDNEDV